MQPVVVLIAAAGLGAGAEAAVSWPEVPTLPRTRYELVSPEMRVNGVLTHIELFDSELSEQEVIQFFRAHWAAAPAGMPKDLRVPGWSALSTMHGPFQIAAQVRPKSGTGSQGRVSIAHLGDIQRDWIPPDLPRFADTEVLQLTETRDGRRRSRLVTMLSREGFEVNVARWRTEWQRRGFTLTHQSGHPVDAAAPQWIGTLVKDGASVDLMVGRSANSRVTQITANLLTDEESRL